MPVTMNENIGVESLVLIDPERAVFCDAERGIVLTDDVRGEVDRVDQPRDQKDPPAP